MIDFLNITIAGRQMHKRDPQVEKLGEILDKSLKRLDLSGRLMEYEVWPIWNETVGPMIARNAQPEKIRHGTLFVRVSSSVWMQQLQYMKETLAEKLNQGLRREVVKNVFFFIGKVEAEISCEKPRSLESPTRAEPNLDEEILRSVKDPEIRRALRRLFTAHSHKRR